MYVPLYAKVSPNSSSKLNVPHLSTMIVIIPHLIPSFGWKIKDDIGGEEYIPSFDDDDLIDDSEEKIK